MPRRQRLQDFFFFFTGEGVGQGQGEIRHDLFVGALPPSEVERGRSVASPGGRLVSDTKYVQTTWRLYICLKRERKKITLLEIANNNTQTLQKEKMFSIQTVPNL